MNKSFKEDWGSCIFFVAIQILIACIFAPSNPGFIFIPMFFIVLLIVTNIQTLNRRREFEKNMDEIIETINSGMEEIRQTIIPNSSEKELKQTAQKWREEVAEEPPEWRSFINKIKRKQ